MCLGQAQRDAFEEQQHPLHTGVVGGPLQRMVQPLETLGLPVARHPPRVPGLFGVTYLQGAVEGQNHIVGQLAKK